jgi:branched-subunit amino acid transport protein
MSALWVATIGASLVCYLIKLAGYSVPASILNNAHFQRINELVPVVLLSALVSIQTLGDERAITVDHRLVGVVVAAIALKIRASFPLMMLAAAISSALAYHFL